MLFSINFFFIIFTKILIVIGDTPMAYCSIHPGETFLPNATSSLIGTRQLSSSSMSTASDCALLCLDIASCQTAIFNNQIGTCTMFSESLNAGGQLASASSNGITTISVEKGTRKLSRIFYFDITEA
jgi:hypothetical protein